MRLLAQRRQVRVRRGSIGDRETHGTEHGVFFGLFHLALFFGELFSFGAAVILAVAFGVPVEVLALLPAAHGWWSISKGLTVQSRRRTGHERVAEIVFALRILLDVFPLEVSAAAADRVLD